jgi:hypothetical protein
MRSRSPAKLAGAAPVSLLLGRAVRRWVGRVGLYGWERELEDEPRAVDLKWMDVMKHRITIRSD